MGYKEVSAGMYQLRQFRAGALAGQHGSAIDLNRLAVVNQLPQLTVVDAHPVGEFVRSTLFVLAELLDRAGSTLLTHTPPMLAVYRFHPMVMYPPQGKPAAEESVK
jgi:hypothetical protein